MLFGCNSSSSSGTIARSHYTTNHVASNDTRSSSCCCSTQAGKRRRLSERAKERRKTHGSINGVRCELTRDLICAVVPGLFAVLDRHLHQLHSSEASCSPSLAHCSLLSSTFAIRERCTAPRPARSKPRTLPTSARISRRRSSMLLPRASKLGRVSVRLASMFGGM